MSSASTVAIGPPSARGRSPIAVLRLAWRRRLGPTSQCSMSKAWVPRAPSTPPPAAAWEYQLQGRLASARLLISQSSFTSHGSPRAPWASKAANCWNKGTARYSKSTPTTQLCCKANFCKANTWSLWRATGFSSSKCLPACSAA